MEKMWRKHDHKVAKCKGAKKENLLTKISQDLCLKNSIKLDLLNWILPDMVSRYQCYGRALWRLEFFARHWYIKKGILESGWQLSYRELFPALSKFPVHVDNNEGALRFEMCLMADDFCLDKFTLYLFNDLMTNRKGTESILQTNIKRWLAAMSSLENIKKLFLVYLN